MKTRSAVVVLSGGMDSTTALYHARALGRDVRTLTFDYGSRHAAREQSAAERIAHNLAVPWTLQRLPADFFGGSALTGTGAIPRGHYADASMKATVVPNRNMILLAFATAYAIQNRVHEIWYGAHAGDHAIYPDCRPAFVDALRRAIFIADWHRVRLVAPFIRKTKRQIAKLGRKLRVPFGETWSCYEGGERHCGLCGTCFERKEALAGFDSTDYQA